MPGWKVGDNRDSASAAGGDFARRAADVQVEVVVVAAVIFLRMVKEPVGPGIDPLPPDDDVQASIED